MEKSMIISNSMEKFRPFIEEWTTKFGRKVRTEPTDVVHLPSLLLGCFVTVTIFSLIPLMKLFVGSLLLTAVTLLKYLVIGGGIIACIKVITTTRSSEDTNKSKLLRHEKQKLVQEKTGAASQPPLRTTVYPSHDGSGLIKDDFDSIKHYDVSIASSKYSNRKIVPTDERAYNSFINRAAMKNVAEGSKCNNINSYKSK